MFASSQAGGLSVALPDVCLTPAGPASASVSYINTATGSMAVPSQVGVLIEAMPQHNLLTIVPVTTGDEAGILCGVVSGVVAGPDRAVTSSAKVIVKGSFATRLGDMHSQNAANAVGSSVVPSQTKVLILS